MPRRSIFFYQVAMRDAGDEWNRTTVLRALEQLPNEQRTVELAEEAVAWVKVDRVPRNVGETGRLRLFRVRRTNFPDMIDAWQVSDLPLAETAGLAEPSHVVFAPDGLVAAEFNHHAPRMSVLVKLFQQEPLDVRVRIGTYIQRNIAERLERLESIQLLELSMVPTQALEDELLAQGSWGEAIVALSQTPGGRRVGLRLSGDKTPGWTDRVKGFVGAVLGMGANDDHAVKVFRVTGYDPAAEGVEVVDLLKQKVTRQAEIARRSPRSNALSSASAYREIEVAIEDARRSDLRTSAVIY